MRRLKAKQQECEQRIQEFEAEVEIVTRKMEELQVWGCRRSLVFFDGYTELLASFPGFSP